MKLNIKGKVGQQEILEFLSKNLNRLEDLGVEEYQGVNLYFHCYRDGEKVFLRDEEGLIDSITTSSAKKHRTHQMVDGKKALSFTTGVSSDIDLSKRSPISDDMGLMTETQIQELRRKEQERYEQRMKELDQEHERIMKERQRVRDERLAAEKKATDHLMGLYGVDEKELRNFTVSKNWLTSSKGIAKYTTKDLGEKAFRIKMRSTEIGGPKTIYLFDTNGVLQESIEEA